MNVNPKELREHGEAMIAAGRAAVEAADALESVAGVGQRMAKRGRSVPKPPRVVDGQEIPKMSDAIVTVLETYKGEPVHVRDIARGVIALGFKSRKGRTTVDNVRKTVGASLPSLCKEGKARKEGGGYYSRSA